MNAICPNCGERQEFPGRGLGAQVACQCCGVAFVLRRGNSPHDQTGMAADKESENLDRLAIKKKCSPLLEWLAYFFALAAIIAFTVRTRLFAAVTADATGLTLFIVMLFFLALIKSAWDVLYIDHQFSLTQRQIRDLWQISRIGEFLRSARPSVFRDHVYNLFTIFHHDREITQDNLVEILHARLNSRTRVVDLSAGILTTLGLIGTIIGMVMAVDGISAVTEAVGGDENLLSKMSETLGGMGTAFYTTLMGAILGGVFLRVLTASVQSSQDYLVAHIAELSEVYIIPRLRRRARELENESANKEDDDA